MNLILSIFHSQIFENCQFLNHLLLISFVYPRTILRAGNEHAWEDRNAYKTGWET
jgi:hypothetical protein